MTKFELHFDGKEDKESIFKQIKEIDLKLEIKVGFSPESKKYPWLNTFYFGNNLEILKYLKNKKEFIGKIDLIYIDPPFGTKQLFKKGEIRTSTISSSLDDEVAYDDSISGIEYINFLQKRLLLLNDFLSEKGSIYVHIDSKMGYQVKLIMDEIFGEENFINDISRIKCNPKNFSRKAYGNYKDLILFYSKSSDYVWNDSLEEYSEDDIKRLFPKKDEKGRLYTTNPLHAPGETKDGETGKAWRNMNPPRGRHWRYKPSVLEQLDNDGLIEWSSTGNPRKIIYADEQIKKKKKRQDIWEFKDPAYPKYPTEKNLELLKTIISASSNPGSIVLDCFAGSGTTLEAAESLGRQWIGMDNSLLAFEAFIKKTALKKSFPFLIYNSSNENLSIIIKKYIFK